MSSDVENRSHRNAFTLIELIVVLVILAMLSSLAMLSVGNIMDKHQLSQAAETIEIFDMRLRREARTNRQPISATLDSVNKTLVLPQADGSERIFRLPSRVQIKSWRIAGKRGAESLMRLPVKGDGRSPSYAIELARGKNTIWVVILGGSGQVSMLDNTRDVSRLMSLGGANS